MNNSNYYLRVEAVNLVNFVYDTNDLSTVRGGGLLLLRAPERLAQSLRDRAPQLGCDIRQVSLGASIAVFEVINATEKQAQEVEKQACEFLRADEKGLQHATVMVSRVANSGDFANDYQQMVARVRWQQMQSPTVRFPGNGSETTSNQRYVCEYDGVRPTSGGVSRSIATKIRQDYGRIARQELYERELQRLPSLGLIHRFPDTSFTNDFQILSSNEKQGLLNRKMAVFYADGNGFGSYFREHFPSADAQQTASNKLQELRAGLLANLLTKTIADLSWKTDEGAIRLETLLWGGDELIWVVPAWKGWEVLRLFFEVTKDWVLESAKELGTKLPLTHGAGLVFCHHNAPIKRIVDLVKYGLTENAKDFGKDYPVGCRNFFAVEVLESFDDLGKDLARSRRIRLPKWAPGESDPEIAKKEFDRHFVFRGAAVRDVLDSVADLKRLRFPRSQLADLVKLVVRRGCGWNHRDVQDVLSFLEKQHHGALEAFEKFSRSIGMEDPPAANESAPARTFANIHAADFWSVLYHLHEWWDYIPANPRSLTIAGTVTP